jgi:type II secretory pathway pseudopilin PulG
MPDVTTHKLRSEHKRGLTLIEVTIFITMVSVALLASLLTYVRYVQMKNLAEQERTALLAAEQKLDEIRTYISQVPIGTAKDASGQLVPMGTNPLDAAFNLYGPLPTSSAPSRPCCFSVSNLPAIGNASVGTVTIINSETPDATQFGYAYDGSGTPQVFCVNLYGNNYPEGGFPTTIPPAPPFPLDLDGDGATTNANVTSGFSLLPVVVTIRWVGPDGRSQRLDLFSLLSNEKGQH